MRVHPPPGRAHLIFPPGLLIYSLFRHVVGRVNRSHRQVVQLTQVLLDLELGHLRTHEEDLDRALEPVGRLEMGGPDVLDHPVGEELHHHDPRHRSGGHALLTARKGVTARNGIVAWRERQRECEREHPEWNTKCHITTSKVVYNAFENEIFNALIYPGSILPASGELSRKPRQLVLCRLQGRPLAPPASAERDRRHAEGEGEHDADAMRIEWESSRVRAVRPSCAQRGLRAVR